MKFFKMLSPMCFVIPRQNKKAELFLRHGVFHKGRSAPLTLTAEENIKGDRFCSVVLQLHCFHRHSCLPVIHFSHRGECVRKLWWTGVYLGQQCGSGGSFHNCEINRNRSSETQFRASVQSLKSPLTLPLTAALTLSAGFIKSWCWKPSENQMKTADLWRSNFISYLRSTIVHHHKMSRLHL